MKKIFLLLFVLQAVFVWTKAQTIVTFTAGTDVYPSSDAGAHSLTKDGVTIAVSNGSFGRTDKFRVYKGQTLTVSSSAGTITKIVMNCTSSYPASNFEALDGLTVDGDNGIWAGSASEVSFLASGAQVRMTSVEVTLGSADPNYVAKPTIAPATGTYYSAQEVTISAGEDATVYYTTDGSEPTASSKAYTAPFTVSETTTVKAIAVKSEIKSGVVESVITIETVTFQTIAELIAAGNADRATTSGTVYAVYPMGFVLGDNTGYIFIYGNNTLSVGDLIDITGRVSQYGGCYQISNATISQTGSASITYPVAKEINGADFDALVAAPVVTFVKVKGTLTSTGNYKCFSVEGATVTGSILTSDAVFGESQVGDEIEVTGFFVYQSGSGKYGNILATLVTSNPTIVAKPSITPATGTYYSAQKVTIVAGKDATVYYTTDGSEPTAFSNAYTAPFTVSETTTVKAIAMKGENKSEVVESVITIENQIQSENVCGDNLRWTYNSGILTIMGNGDMYEYDDKKKCAPWCQLDLQTVIISEGVTSIGSYAFYGCSGLTDITIPSSMLKIGNYAFKGCSNLGSLTIPSSVISLGKDVFDYNSNLVVNMSPLENVALI